MTTQNITPIVNINCKGLTRSEVEAIVTDAVQKGIAQATSEAASERKAIAANKLREAGLLRATETAKSAKKRLEAASARNSKFTVSGMEDLQHLESAKAHFNRVEAEQNLEDAMLPFKVSTYEAGLRFKSTAKRLEAVAALLEQKVDFINNHTLIADSIEEGLERNPRYSGFLSARQADGSFIVATCFGGVVIKEQVL